jgi:hypothetical protein
MVERLTLTDRDAAIRYDEVAGEGQRIFADSAFVDSTRDISDLDLLLVKKFHRAVSPVDPEDPWRLTRQDRSIARGEIADPSIFANWEMAGGPLEHMQLAPNAAKIIIRELKANLRESDFSSDFRVNSAIQTIEALDSNHTAAAVALHDEGREITHLFYTNDLIGRRLFQRIGIREDLTSILPDEDVMQVTNDEINRLEASMKVGGLSEEAIASIQEELAIKRRQVMESYFWEMNPEAVLVQIADEFGKRKGQTTELWQVEDFNPSTQRTWGENYTKRPRSGRPSDDHWREIITRHNENAPAYFAAMDAWVRSVSTLTLSDLCDKVNGSLSPTLRPIGEILPVTSEIYLMMHYCSGI